MKRYFTGQKLRELRKSKGITATQLAKDMGYSQSYISRFETDRATPDINALGKMLEILGTDLSSYFGNERTRQQNDLVKATNQLSTAQIQKLIEFIKSLNP